MNRQDHLLEQMGITRWTLRKPEALKGAVRIAADDDVRLVVIADQAPDKNAGLFQDILRALKLQSADCLCLDFAQAQHFAPRPHLYYWLLGKNFAEIDRTLPGIDEAAACWQSPPWAEFKASAAAKRELWTHIYTTLHDDD